MYPSILKQEAPCVTAFEQVSRLTITLATTLKPLPQPEALIFGNVSGTKHNLDT